MSTNMFPNDPLYSERSIRGQLYSCTSIVAYYFIRWYINCIAFPLYLVWSRMPFRKVRERPEESDIATLDGRPHVLFVVEAEGNGHFRQMHNLMGMLDYCPQDAVISVAWNQDQCPSPMYMSDPRIVHRIHMPGQTLVYDSNGRVLGMETALYGLNPIKYIQVITAGMSLVEFTQRTHVTRIINLFSSTFGTVAPLTDLRLPVDNIASQYVHLDSGRVSSRYDDVMSDSFMGALQHIALRIYIRMATVTTPGSRVVPITPFSSVGTISFSDKRTVSTRLSLQSRTDPVVVLVYMLKTTQLVRVAEIASQVPNAQFICFSKNVPTLDGGFPRNMVVQGLSAEKFRQQLVHCSILWTTGGYMLPCEALTINKHILLTPTTGHLEQHINSLYFASTFSAWVTTCAFYSQEAAIVHRLVCQVQKERDVVPPNTQQCDSKFRNPSEMVTCSTNEEIIVQD
jgi:hypothetical protein